MTFTVGKKRFPMRSTLQVVFWQGSSSCKGADTGPVSWLLLVTLCWQTRQTFWWRHAWMCRPGEAHLMLTKANPARGQEMKVWPLPAKPFLFRLILLPLLLFSLLSLFTCTGANTRFLLPGSLTEALLFCDEFHQVRGVGLNLLAMSVSRSRVMFVLAMRKT